MSLKYSPARVYRSYDRSEICSKIFNGALFRCISPTLLSFFLLANCSSVSNETISVSNRIEGLLNDRSSSEADGISGALVDVEQGFVSALSKAVLANHGYLAAISMEREAFAQAGMSASWQKPQLPLPGQLGFPYYQLRIISFVRFRGFLQWRQKEANFVPGLVSNPGDPGIFQLLQI